MSRGKPDDRRATRCVSDYVTRNTIRGRPKRLCGDPKALWQKTRNVGVLVKRRFSPLFFHHSNIPSRHCFRDFPRSDRPLNLFEWGLIRDAPRVRRCCSVPIGASHCLVGSCVDCRDLASNHGGQVAADIERTSASLERCRGAIVAVGTQLPAAMYGSLHQRAAARLAPGAMGKFHG